MAKRIGVEVTVLYFVGCPNWQTAVERVQAAAKRAGVPVLVSTLAVESDEDAARLGFTGSPTVLLAGTDPFAQPRSSSALACRLYSTPDGLAGSPTVDQVVAALVEHVDSPTEFAG
jgi:hypothetical protein